MNRCVTFDVEYPEMLQVLRAQVQVQVQVPDPQVQVQVQVQVLETNC